MEKELTVWVGHRKSNDESMISIWYNHEYSIIEKGICVDGVEHRFYTEFRVENEDGEVVYPVEGV